MPQLIKDGNIVENDNWLCLDEEQCSGSIPNASFIPLSVFLNSASASLPEEIGVWLSASDDVNTLALHLEHVKKIACRIENFMDGRNFSQARILRDQLGYSGGIRAIGGFIEDQLFFLKRCGFDEFQFDKEADIKLIQESLHDFSESYQAACDISEPLFRRRSS